MKNILIPVALLFGVLVQTGEAQQMPRITHEWTSVWGRWDVNDKGVISGRGFLKYSYDMPPDFLFKGQTRIEQVGEGGGEGGTRFEICFRRNPNEERPTYLLRIRFDSIALIKWDQTRETLDEKKADVPQKTWMKLELQMKANKIQAKVGNNIRLQAIDPEPIEHNLFLISAVGVVAELKDLKIADLK